MTNGKSLEGRKTKFKEVESKIDEKTIRLSELENAKVAAREARQRIESLDLDDEAREQVIADTNEAYESISEDTKEVSDELGEDIKELEEQRQETTASLDAAKAAQEAEDNLVTACAENGVIVPRVKGIENNIGGNQELLNEIIQKMQEADAIAGKLGRLSN